MNFTFRRTPYMLVITPSDQHILYYIKQFVVFLASNRVSLFSSICLKTFNENFTSVFRAKMKCCIKCESFVMTKIIHESFPRDFFHDPKRKNQQNGRIIFFGMFKAPRKRSYALVNSLHLAASVNFSFSRWFRACTRLKRNILTSINYLSNVENKKCPEGCNLIIFTSLTSFSSFKRYFQYLLQCWKNNFDTVAMHLKWSPRAHKVSTSLNRKIKVLYTARERQGIM